MRDNRRNLQRDHQPMNVRSGGGGNYGIFFAMIGTSMVTMYLVTYLNSYQIFDHAWFSETRLFMTLIMGSVMAIVMLSFMLGMYRDRRVNLAIFAGAFVLLLSAVWLVRSQASVTDVDYMEAMIPHHSIAILTSERARIKDPRVRELADEIIKAQRREIAEMEWLIEDIRAYDLAASQEEAEARPVPDFPASPE